MLGLVGDPLGALGAAGVILVLGFFSGCQVQGWRMGEVINGMKADAYKAAQEAQAQADLIEALQRDKADLVAQAELLRNQEREQVERVVTDEVVTYVQTDAAGDCGLDPAGVRIHNIAAAGTVPADPQPATPSDEGAGGSSAAEVIQVVTGNYATCHQIRDQLITLQDWVDQVLAPGREVAGPSQRLQ